MDTIHSKNLSPRVQVHPLGHLPQRACGILREHLLNRLNRFRLHTELATIYNTLKSKWELRIGGKKAFPDELYLRFALCSRPAFDFKSAWTVMKRFDRRYLNLSITSMQKQLQTKRLFPVAGLKSRAGHDMLYMRPSRFFPGEESADKIIDNLVYVMGTMLEKEQACVDGIGVIMNMTDWKMTNFSVKYWHKLMMTLQGRRVPARVSLLLIINPPSWFWLNSGYYETHAR